jgi:L-rhamnose mutarotase
MARYCFALDLKDDEKLIAEYEHFHKKENAWPAITKSIRDAHILDMEIYRTGNRLFMIMEVSAEYSQALKASIDANEPKVKEWETLMDTYQQRLPWAKEGEKWVPMQEIFKL